MGVKGQREDRTSWIVAPREHAEADRRGENLGYNRCVESVSLLRCKKVYEGNAKPRGLSGMIERVVSRQEKYCG